MMFCRLDLLPNGLCEPETGIRPYTLVPSFSPDIQSWYISGVVDGDRLGAASFRISAAGDRKLLFTTADWRLALAPLDRQSYGMKLRKVYVSALYTGDFVVSSILNIMEFAVFLGRRSI